MFEKIKTFWVNFWASFKNAYNKAFKTPPKIDSLQEFRDTKRLNLLAIFSQKLNNYANIEATFSVESDSTQVEELERLAGDLEEKRQRLTEEMLGVGDVWVFPAHDDEGKIYHRIVTQDKVRILSMEGERETDIIAVIDEYIDEDNQVYLLNRRHTLFGGVLTIETYTTTVQNVRVNFEPWVHLTSIYQFNNVDTIGAGRFKSPVSSRGKSPVYGVPINFGCEEIEATIFEDLKLIDDEFRNAQSKIFADPFILRKGKDKVGQETWRIPENIFPIDTRGGQTGANIDIFSPSIRYEQLRAKLMDDMAKYEQQVGTDKGFLTPFDSGKATTATEIRRSNASTIALIASIRDAIRRGVVSTIKADAMLLNISDDLYSVKTEWFDVFADEAEQYQRLANAVDRGVAEKADEIRWLFPDLSSDDIEAKLERIAEEKQANAKLFTLDNESKKQVEREGEEDDGK